MKIAQSSSINFSGIKLYNPAYKHAKYVNQVLKVNGIYVYGHKTFRTNNDFASKRNIVNYVRSNNNFCDNECGFLFLPWSRETWVIGKHSAEQQIKRILDRFSIDSEINLGM